MNRLCPVMDELVECHTCGSQTLPPIKLCVSAHVTCSPCFEYLSRCCCGGTFAYGPHTVVNWLASAMKLKCKYYRNGRQPSPGEDLCRNRWFTMQDISHHYRNECTRNAFRCPIKNCSHYGRIDTIVEHYESAAHMPIEVLKPNNPHRPNRIVFRISS